MFRKTTLLSKIKTTLDVTYRVAESFFKPIHIPFKKSKKNLVQFKKMNNLMKHVYFRKELVIDNFDDIKFFRFKSAIDAKDLSGLVYEPNKGSDKWVISAHWFAGDKWWGLYHALMFAKMGYNIMSFDFRGHGESQWDTPTMGLKESRDLIGAIQWLNKNRKYTTLSLLGTSMGAYTVSYTSIKYPELMKKYNVKFGISDCPYGSVENLFMHERNVYLKFIPKKYTKALVNKIIKKHNKFEAKNNINLYDGNIFKLLEKNKTPAFPIFYNHSKNDLVTPFPDTYQTFIDRKNLIKGDEINVYNYAMHTQSLRIHFKTYVNKITSFIATQDNSEQQYNQLVKDWKLNEVSNWKDKKDQRLK